MINLRVSLSLIIALLIISAGPVPQIAKSDVEQDVIVPEALARPDAIAALPVKTKPNYDLSVLEPLYQEQTQKVEDAKAAAAEAAKQAQEAAEAIPKSTPAPQMAAPVPALLNSGLLGEVGYSLPSGNCVDLPGIHNPGYGNPIAWPVLATSPSIGATVLFVFNHTARVVGIWSNGDVEVAQENAPGMPHRIPTSMIRGYR